MNDNTATVTETPKHDATQDAPKAPKAKGRKGDASRASNKGRRAVVHTDKGDRKRKDNTSNASKDNKDRIQSVISKLDTAHEAKDRDAQKKLRRQLRSMGVFIGEMTDQQIDGLRKGRSLAQVGYEHKVA